MKKITLLIILCFIGIQANAHTTTDYFNTTWKTDNILTRSSNDSYITKITITGETFSYDVDLGNNANLAPCTGTTTYTIASGWDNGAPDSNTAAIIAENYNTSLGNIDACSITVNLGATLTVRPDEYVEVQQDITNNGTIIVESEYNSGDNSVSMGSIVQVLESSSATNTGTINVQYSTPLMAPKTFVGVGSPMTGQTRDGVFNSGYLFLDHHTMNFTPDGDVGGIFGEAFNFADDNGDNWAPYNEGLNPGEGYMLFPQLNGNDGDKSYDFTFSNGTFNNGDIDFPVKFNQEAQKSPNMVANPYPSAISASDFITANTAIVDEIFFWSPNTPPSTNLPGYYSMNFSMQDISMHNGTGGLPAPSNPLAVPNGYITTARAFGFMAREEGTVHFTNAMRVKDNNTSSVPRPANIADRVWVQVKNGQYQMQNTTLLAFSELTTAGLDQGYDSNRLATIVSLYTHLDTENGELGIQSREAFEDKVKVPMGFSTMLDANLDYSISLGNIEGSNLLEATIYLIDNELNIITNLSDGDYTFKAEKGTYDRRFTLQFIEEGVLGNQEQELSTVIMAPNPAKNVVNISNSQQLNLETLDIYDLRGRLMQSVDLKNMGTVKTIDVSMLAAATYLVKISGKEGQITKRLLKE